MSLGISLPYPPHSLGIEITILALSAIIQCVRLSIGSMANKTEGSLNMLWLIILTVPTLFYLAFFIRLQTYVLVFELFTCSIGFIFQGIELILGIIMFVSFKRREKEA